MFQGRAKMDYIDRPMQYSISAQISRTRRNQNALQIQKFKE